MAAGGSAGTLAENELPGLHQRAGKTAHNKVLDDGVFKDGKVVSL